MKNLKYMVVRSGLVRLCGQAVNFLLTLASAIVMARLLDPHDYGIVAMVTSITGIYAIFATAGLSEVTVQRANITDEQLSVLFWMNILVGSLFALLCLATAPVLVAFYREPRLLWVTIVLGAGFIINALGIQHYSLLQRQMRFVVLTTIEIVSRVASFAIGITVAIAGFEYWALVVMSIAWPAITAALFWVATGWIPGPPKRHPELGGMLRYGGVLTLNRLVSYLTYNVDKILLGRVWGAEVLGLYGRAFQLINIPTENLNSAIGGVTFSALSRLQDDSIRLKHYFVTGYSLVNSLTIPTTIFCFLFSHDIILVVLGPKWLDAEPIFRLLAPTILIFGIINPLGYLLFSIGLQARSLKMALVIAPIVISAILIGLPFGANGVAACFSMAMALWLIPHLLWSISGTFLSLSDVLFTILRPLLSAIGAAAAAFGAQHYFGDLHTPFFRLGLESIIMFLVYYFILLYVMGQMRLYLDLLRTLRTPPKSSFDQVS